MSALYIIVPDAKDILLISACTTALFYSIALCVILHTRCYLYLGIAIPLHYTFVLLCLCNVCIQHYIFLLYIYIYIIVETCIMPVEFLQNGIVIYIYVIVMEMSVKEIVFNMQGNHASSSVYECNRQHMQRTIFIPHALSLSWTETVVV